MLHIRSNHKLAPFEEQSWKNSTMIVLRYDVHHALIFLLSIHRKPSLVSGWVFSPVAVKKTTTKSSVHRECQRGVSILTRLHHDFTDGENDFFGEESNGIEYFNDFSDFDFTVGDNAAAFDENSDSTNAPDHLPETSLEISVLQQRLQKLTLNEQMNRQQISDNWKEGYWGVWGCSLDPYTAENPEKTVVTCIRHMKSSMKNDNDDDDDDDVVLLIVGRSDGSICWLQMEQPSTSSSQSTLPSDCDPRNSVENRSVTTFFENKLVAKATDDGGMIVGTALQRREENSENDYGKDDLAKNADSTDELSPRLPFDILAQIQTASVTQTDFDAGAAIVDMLPLPSVRMLWTISHGTPNIIDGWQLDPDPETGILFPTGGTSSRSSKVEIEIVHTSPIIAMKVIPKSSDGNGSEDLLVVSVSDNGQVVVWEVKVNDIESPPSIRIRLDTNLLRGQPGEENDENDSFSTIDVDDQFLYIGSRAGRISIFSWSSITEDDPQTADSGPLHSLPLVKSFLGFTSKNPGVTSLLAAGPGVLGAKNGNSDNNNSNRPPTKSLIAGDMAGGLKQWELIPSGGGRLEYWPRMASQKLPGGKPHVYETSDYSMEDPEDDGSLLSPAIKELVCIQQVLLAATDHDLTVWDSTTGKSLYDMQGLSFNLATEGGKSIGKVRPSLIVLNDSVLLTNGMEGFVCVHDFAMDRVTSDNANNFLERDDAGDDNGNGDENDSQNNW